MGYRFEIMCATKSDSTPDKISHIGGHSPIGRWNMSEDVAIKGILSDNLNFYIKKAGSEIDVIVSKSKNGDYYLKVQGDEGEVNSLFNLQDCPVM